MYTDVTYSFKKKKTLTKQIMHGCKGFSNIYIFFQTKPRIKLYQISPSDKLTGPVRIWKVHLGLAIDSIISIF